MRVVWSFGLIVSILASQAMAQVSARWYDLYNAQGYETLFANWLLDGQGNLYVLATLHQPNGSDGLALLRYTLQGARQSVEPFGLNDPYQEVGFALYLRPDNTLYILAHVREPVTAVGADPNVGTILYQYPNLAMPFFTASGIPIDSFMFPNVAGRDIFLWASNPPAFGRLDGGTVAYDSLPVFERVLGLSGNWRNQIAVVSGWRGSAAGRTATYAFGSATGLPQAVRTLDGPFGFVAEAFPVSSDNFIVLWGTGDQSQLLMHGPDGIEAETLSMRTSYGTNDTLYVYILGHNEDGSAFLVRIEPNSQTRLWTHTFPQFRVSAWAVDPEGRAHLLGTDADGFALWRFEPDGRAQRLTFELPGRQEFWFYDPPRLIPLNRGLWLIGSSAFRRDPIHEQYEPFHSFVGVFAQRGDTNGDGCVDDIDLLTVLFSYGGNTPEADVNGDGIVNDADLLEVLSNFAAGC
ncbi:hypothetical protein HRbin15_02571 [bacterium HR15]|nr:hypothetical protein HRbin15_02571 [bacterium HR15]